MTSRRRNIYLSNYAPSPKTRTLRREVGPPQQSDTKEKPEYRYTEKWARVKRVAQAISSVDIWMDVLIETSTLTAKEGKKKFPQKETRGEVKVLLGKKRMTIK